MYKSYRVKDTQITNLQSLPLFTVDVGLRLQVVHMTVLIIYSPYLIDIYHPWYNFPFVMQVLFLHKCCVYMWCNFVKSVRELKMYIGLPS